MCQIAMNRDYHQSQRTRRTLQEKEEGKSTPSIVGAKFSSDREAHVQHEAQPTAYSRPQRFIQERLARLMPLISSMRSQEKHFQS